MVELLYKKETIEGQTVVDIIREFEETNNLKSKLQEELQKDDDHKPNRLSKNKKIVNISKEEDNEK